MPVITLRGLGVTSKHAKQKARFWPANRVSVLVWPVMPGNRATARVCGSKWQMRADQR
jgi:hypothetical protein